MRMLLRVGKEWGAISGFREVIVVGKLCRRTSMCSVILHEVHIHSQVHLNDDIGAFCLPVSFRVKGGEQLSFDA